MNFDSRRNHWLESDDKELLSDCSVEVFQASGPGGQKRNRKYSAVRITHKLTNISVTSTETRSQIDNRRIALKKLRIKLAVKVRGPVVVLNRKRVSLSSKEYPLWVASLFDRLDQFNFSIGDAAKSLDISTSRLIKLIARDPDIWKIINEQRETQGLKKLRQ